MIVRSTVLEGSVDEAHRAEFDRRMSREVRDAILRYPGIRGLKLLRPMEQKPGAPPVHLIFDLHFDTLDDMRGALESSIRQEVRQLIAAAMRPFKGRVYHLVLAEA
jgi:hypothetical protein